MVKAYMDIHTSTPHNMDVYMYSPCFQGLTLLSFSCPPVYHKDQGPTSSLPVHGERWRNNLQWSKCHNVVLEWSVRDLLQTSLVQERGTLIQHSSSRSQLHSVGGRERGGERKREREREREREHTQFIHMYTHIMHIHVATLYVPVYQLPLRVRLTTTNHTLQSSVVATPDSP